MTVEELLAMAFGEIDSINDDIDVIRVHNGWIYMFYEGTGISRTLKSTCFVAEMSHTIRTS